MFTSILDGSEWENKVQWQKTMRVGNPHNEDANTQLGIEANSAVAVFVFGDDSMIAKMNDGTFYSILFRDEISTNDPQKAIDWLWSNIMERGEQ